MLAMEYNATTTRILNISPYSFFAVIGIVFASSFFILLLLKYGFSIPRYTKIFFISGIGLIIGAKIFGCLTGLYIALANNEPITLETFMNTGIVYYGGLIGFLVSFLLVCKYWNKNIDYNVVDLAVICIPLFHFFGRLGCFFSGCCYGIENQSNISFLYTNKVNDEIVSAIRLPIQLIEAGINIFIFFILIKLLNMEKIKKHLMRTYLIIYAFVRLILEFFRDDYVRGIWHGVSFSQVFSFIIIMVCIISLFIKKENVYVRLDN